MSSWARLWNESGTSMQPLLNCARLPNLIQAPPRCVIYSEGSSNKWVTEQLPRLNFRSLTVSGNNQDTRGWELSISEKAILKEQSLSLGMPSDLTRMTLTPITIWGWL